MSLAALPRSEYEGGTAIVLQETETDPGMSAQETAETEEEQKVSSLDPTGSGLTAADGGWRVEDAGAVSLKMLL